METAYVQIADQTVKWHFIDIFYWTIIVFMNDAVKDGWGRNGELIGFGNYVPICVYLEYDSIYF